MKHLILFVVLKLEINSKSIYETIMHLFNSFLSHTFLTFFTLLESH